MSEETISEIVKTLSDGQRNAVYDIIMTIFDPGFHLNVKKDRKEFDSMTDDQKTVAYGLVGIVLNVKEGSSLDSLEDLKEALCLLNFSKYCDSFLVKAQLTPYLEKEFEII